MRRRQLGLGGYDGAGSDPASVAEHEFQEREFAGLKLEGEGLDRVVVAVGVRAFQPVVDPARGDEPRAPLPDVGGRRPGDSAGVRRL
jgi:hypothetical protein